jgi:hypothetical protein
VSRLRIGEKIPDLPKILVEYLLAGPVCRSESCVSSQAAGDLTADELTNRRTGLFPGHDRKLLVFR